MALLGAILLGAALAGCSDGDATATAAPATTHQPGADGASKAQTPEGVASSNASPASAHPAAVDVLCVAVGTDEFSIDPATVHELVGASMPVPKCAWRLNGSNFGYIGMDIIALKDAVVAEGFKLVEDKAAADHLRGVPDDRLRLITMRRGKQTLLLRNGNVLSNDGNDYPVDNVEITLTTE